MELETSKYHIVKFRGGYKVFIIDYRKIRALNRVLGSFPKGYQFKHEDQAILRFKSNELHLVASALGIQKLPEGL